MLGSLEPIVQKDIADCGVAALAMVLGRPYREVSDRARAMCKKPHKTGMYLTDVNRVAATFHAAFRRRSCSPVTNLRLEFDDDPTGIVNITRVKKNVRESHFVAIFQGVVIDPCDGLIWDLDTYLLQGGWSVIALLERTK